MRHWAWVLAGVFLACSAAAAQPGAGRDVRPPAWPPRPGHMVPGFGTPADWARAEEKTRQFVKDHYPPFVDETLTALKEKDAGGYRESLGQFALVQVRYDRLVGQDRRQAEAVLAESRLRTIVEHTAEQYRAAAEAEEQKILREKTWDEAGKLFDATQARRMLEVADFQKRLDQIRESLKQHESSRDGVVAAFVERYLAPPGERQEAEGPEEPPAASASRPATRPAWSMTQRIERRMLAAVQEANPQRAKELAELKQSNPRRYWALLGQEWQETQRRMIERRVHPQLVKEVAEQQALERQARELGRKFLAAAEADRPAIRAELTTVAGKWFDVAGRRISAEAKRIEQQLDRIKLDIEQRQRLRTQILMKYVSRLLLEDTPEM